MTAKVSPNDVDILIIPGHDYPRDQPSAGDKEGLWPFLQILVAADDADLDQTLDQITAPLFAFVSILRSSDHEVLNRVISKHQEIISVLQKGTPERISETIDRHVKASYDRYLYPQTTGARVSGENEKPKPAPTRRQKPSNRRRSAGFTKRLA